MSIHIFIDESIRRDFLICAVSVDAHKVQHCRKTMRSLIRTGQRRLHFAKEDPERRRRILTRIVELPISADYFKAQGHAVSARRTCLRDMMIGLADHPVSRLVIELSEPEFQRDKQTVGAMKPNIAWLNHASLEHMKGHEEPMLWLPDALAWAHGAGPEWRSLIAKVPERTGETRNPEPHRPETPRVHFRKLMPLAS